MAPAPIPIRTVTRVTLIKFFPYRNNNQEEFSNSYAFKDPPPQTPAEWDALINSLIQVELPIFPPSVNVTRAYGYTSNDPKQPHVYAFAPYTDGIGPAGSYARPSDGAAVAGDEAAFVWWKTNRMSIKGKAVYLRKYLHAATVRASNVEMLHADYVAMLEHYANQINTTVWGGIVDPNYDTTTTALGVGPFITTRTLKRRGKRPVPKA